MELEEEEELESERKESSKRENLMLRQVSGLISPTVLLALFKVFLPTEPPSHATRKDLSPFRVVFSRYVDAPWFALAILSTDENVTLCRGLIGLCKLCQNLLAGEHPARLSLLNTLAHAIVTNLWRLLTATIEFHEVVEKGVTGTISSQSRACVHVLTSKR
jgi:hypothetical protein